MNQPDDEASRLLSYLIAVYELAFGFILANGATTYENGLALIRSALALFLAGVGLHLFVNIESVSESEFLRKHHRLWLGIVALLGGIGLAGIVSTNALGSHLFFLIFMLYILLQFLYHGMLRKTVLLGAATYGIIRLLAVAGGIALAGISHYRSIPQEVLYLLAAYGIFHVICEFLRWNAEVKGTRIMILFGFVLQLGLLVWLFYEFANSLDELKRKIIVLSLTMVLLWLVAMPPLIAIRSVKAKPLLAIFPKGLAGGTILTIIFFVALHKEDQLLWLVLIPIGIIALGFRKEKENIPNHDIQP